MPVSDAARHDLYNGFTELLEREIGQLRIELRGKFNDGLAAVNGRLDTLFLALLAGLFVVLAAMAGLVATTL